MNGLDSLLRQPRPVLVSQRKNKYLLYESENRQVVVLSATGKAVWDKFSQATTLRDVIRADASHVADAQHLCDTAAVVDQLLNDGMLLSVGVETSASLEKELPLPSPDRNPLKSLYIHMTDRCNLQCIYCYNAGYRESTEKQPDLDFDTLRRLLDEAASLSVKGVVFTGGEPLLKRECIQAANYAHSLGMRTSCLTNGTLLTRRAAGAADAFDQVVVSLDSWVPEVNDRIRVGSRFERIASGIKSLVALGVKVTIRPVITRHNIKNIAGFPEWAQRELGCTRFQPALCSPISPDDLALIDMLPDVENYGQAMHDFRQAMRKVGSEQGSDVPTKTRTSQCGAGTGLLSIAPNGDVFPCQCLHVDGKAVGNIHQQKLESIWRSSPQLVAFRQQRPAPFSSCADCAIQGLCTLNCRAMYEGFRDEEKTLTEAMCRFSAAEVEDKLWREAERLVGTV